MDQNSLPISIPSFKLSHAKLEHILVLQAWCKTDNEVEQWAGPSFRFLSNAVDSFSSLTSGNYQSLALHEQSEFVGFGQYQINGKSLHLARLIVSPHKRGKGIISALIALLLEHANADNSIEQLTLYVNKDNVGAQSAYRKQGFVFKPLAKNNRLANTCYLMVLPLQQSF